MSQTTVGLNSVIKKELDQMKDEVQTIEGYKFSYDAFFAKILAHKKQILKIILTKPYPPKPPKKSANDPNQRKLEVTA